VILTVIYQTIIQQSFRNINKLAIPQKPISLEKNRFSKNPNSNQINIKKHFHKVYHIQKQEERKNLIYPEAKKVKYFQLKIKFTLK
jgi:hypothetical protein